MAKGLTTKNALKYYEEMKAKVGNKTSFRENFADDILGIENKTDQDMIAKLLKEEKFKIFDNIVEAKWEGIPLVSRRVIDMTDTLVDLRAIYDTIQASTSTKTQTLGYKLLENIKPKNFSQISTLLTDAKTATAVENFTDDEIATLAKKLAKKVKSGEKLSTKILDEAIVDMGKTANNTVDVIK